MEPTTLLPIVSILLLITVEWGGWALLHFLTASEPITDFKRGFFRTGHSHAGVLLTLALVYYLYLPRADYSDVVEWISGIVLTVGILAQSGGFFLHVFVGRENEKSLGTTVTRAGAVLIAAALIILAVGLIKTT
jgi:hypothetical protein